MREAALPAWLRRLLRGAAAGLVLTVLALLCVEAWQPGFLALREAAGWATVGFCVAGGAALGGGTALLFHSRSRARSYVLRGLAAALLVVIVMALVSRPRERPRPSS